MPVAFPASRAVLGTPDNLLHLYIFTIWVQCIHWTLSLCDSQVDSNPGWCTHAIMGLKLTVNSSIVLDFVGCWFFRRRGCVIFVVDFFVGEVAWFSSGCCIAFSPFNTQDGAKGRNWRLVFATEGAGRELGTKNSNFALVPLRHGPSAWRVNKTCFCSTHLSIPQIWK